MLRHHLLRSIVALRSPRISYASERISLASSLSSSLHGHGLQACRYLSLSPSASAHQQELQAADRPQQDRQHDVSMKLRIENILEKKPAGTLLDVAESNVVASFIHKSCKPRDALSREIIEYAQQLHERLLYEGVVPVRNSVWAALIRGYSHLGLYQPAKAVLDQMEVCHERKPDFYPRPHEYHYSTLLHGCALNGSDEALQLAETLIQITEERKFTTIEMYNNLIKCHVVRAKTVYGAAARAEDWLIKITKLASQPDRTIVPNAITFNLVLRAWKDTPEEQGASRAHEILKLLCQVSHADETSFGTVISAYAIRGQMEPAEHTLRDAVMYFGDKQQEVDLKQCLDEVCYGWAKLGQAERIQTIMQRYGPFIPRTHVTHGACLEAYLRTNDIDSAEQYLDKMIKEYRIQPTRREFATVLTAFHKANLADRAVTLLRRMIQYAEMRGIRCFPEPHDVTQCIDLLRNSKTMSEDDIAKEITDVTNLGYSRRIINAEGFAMAINYMCDINRPFDAGYLLQHMEKLADTTNFQWPSYAAGLYTRIVSAFARRKDSLSAENAFEILSNMQHQGRRAVSPTIRTYTAVIVAFRNVPSRRSAEIVKEIYKEIKSLDRDPASKVRFDQKCFEQILWTMEGSKTPKYTSWALSILFYQIKLYVDEDRKDVEPNSSCMNATLRSMLNVGYLDDAIELSRIISDHQDKRLLRYMPSRPVLEETVSALKKKERMLEAKLIQGIIDKHFPDEYNRQDVNIKIIL